MSYHIRKIPRGTFGHHDKITEEYLEFMDSLDQDNILMALHELSDMIGAIEEWLKKRNLTLNDLMIMKDATQRAFKSGHRKPK